MAAIGIVLGLALLGGQAEPAPLAPAGAWGVNVEDDMCVLSRPFGRADRPVTIALRQSPLAEIVTLVMIQPDGSGNSKASRGQARIILTPSGKRVEGEYLSAILPPDNRRATMVTLDRAVFDEIGTSSMVSVAAEGAAIRFAPTATAAGLRALDDCTSKVMQLWGIDPAEQAAIAQPAKAANSAMWFELADYPKEALRQSLGGTSMILWRIGVDGRVSDCKTIGSSGNALLDEAACGAILRRGRYSPALNKDGVPVPSSATRRVTWMLPRTIRR